MLLVDGRVGATGHDSLWDRKVSVKCRNPERGTERWLRLLVLRIYMKFPQTLSEKLTLNKGAEVSLSAEELQSIVGAIQALQYKVTSLERQIENVRANRSYNP